MDNAGRAQELIKLVDLLREVHELYLFIKLHYEYDARESSTIPPIQNYPMEVIDRAPTDLSSDITEERSALDQDVLGRTWEILSVHCPDIRKYREALDTEAAQYQYKSLGYYEFVDDWSDLQEKRRQIEHIGNPDSLEWFKDLEETERLEMTRRLLFWALAILHAFTKDIVTETKAHIIDLGLFAEEQTSFIGVEELAAGRLDLGRLELLVKRIEAIYETKVSATQYAGTSDDVSKTRLDEGVWKGPHPLSLFAGRCDMDVRTFRKHFGEHLREKNRQSFWLRVDTLDKPTQERFNSL